MTEVADLLMPKLGLTMTEGTVARWIAAPGVRFAAGDVVVIVETDKIANEVEAPAAGELVTLLSSEGEVIPVGTPIARWRLDSGVHTARTSSAGTPHAGASAGPQSTVPRTDASRSSPNSPERIFATPYARRLAREAGTRSRWRRRIGSARTHQGRGCYADAGGTGGAA